MNTKDWIEYNDEVKRARKEKKPLVALESTIITHGMPYPQNRETAQAVEEIIRENDAVPATIAIKNGKIHVGLEPEEMEEIAQNSEAVKVSRRDLAITLTRRQTGGTTVSATMFCARVAGIPVFVTGGTGGVHRGFGETLDVSADLEELGQTSVAVVCAGVKSILDIPATLEYLETRGVPVISYGSDDFPAFYTSSSGIKAPIRMDDIHTIARCMQTQWSLGLNTGLVIANPLPQAHSLEPALINSAIEEALSDAHKRNIHGRDITPFVLEKLVEKTGGASLKANIQLIRNNARLGARLSVAYSQIEPHGNSI